MTVIHLRYLSGVTVSIKVDAKPMDVNGFLRRQRNGEVTREKHNVTWKETAA